MGEPPSPRPFVEEVVTYKPGRSVAGLVKLSSNESMAPPGAAVVEAMIKAAQSAHQYPAHDCVEVKLALMHHLRDIAVASGFQIDQDNIVVGNGSVALLRHIFETYVAPGDVVVSPWPSFEAYPIFSHIRHAKWVGVPNADEMADTDAILRAVAAHAPRLVLLATPNNPTGAVIDHRGLLDILAASSDDTLVVLDKAYVEFEPQGKHAEALALLAADSRVIVLGTLSKAFSLAGVRVGYGVAHPHVAGAIERMRTPFEVSSLAQVAAVAALAAPEAALASVARVAAERDRCLAALSVEGLPVAPSHANFVWIPFGAATTRVAEKIYDDGFVVREIPDVGLRITVVEDEAVNSAWVESVVRAWHLPEFDLARTACSS